MKERTVAPSNRATSCCRHSSTAPGSRSSSNSSCTRLATSCKSGSIVGPPGREPAGKKLVMNYGAIAEALGTRFWQRTFPFSSELPPAPHRHPPAHLGPQRMGVLQPSGVRQDRVGDPEGHQGTPVVARPVWPCRVPRQNPHHPESAETSIAERQQDVRRASRHPIRMRTSRRVGWDRGLELPTVSLRLRHPNQP